jgi:serine-type D-Ala-D-Ala carboxypeptidase/endopeptidase (penicillin-binding protein 4)
VQDVPSSAVAALQHDIDGILAAPALSHGLWGVLVKSLARDETWYSLNAGKLMMPASSMKVITLAATAEKLGWDYRYETRLLVTGPISDGVLHGDLLVVGSGDPSIDDWDGAATRLFGTWADQLKTAGVRTIEGRIVGDDNAFDDDGLGFGWSWDDLVAGFAAGVSALQFNENVVRVTVAPGGTVGAAASVALTPNVAEAGLLSVHSLVTTGVATSAPAVERRRLPGSVRLELRGSVPLKGRPIVQTMSVDNPTLYFVTALRAALIANGVDVLGQAVDADDLDAVPSPTGAPPVVTYQSPPFAVLATTLMKFSQNQYAETFLKTIGANGQPGTAEAGRAAIRAVLEDWDVGTAGLIQADGSGLSRYNYVTPDTLVAILSHVDRDERLRERYEATLPIAGRDSTVVSRMKGTAAEGNARIKDGAMANVRAMTGYVRTADREKLVFAILANNFDGPASTITAAADAIVVRLATFRR